MTWLSYVVAGGTKAWEELIEPDVSPQIQFSRGNATYTRYFKVPTADAETFKEECFPSAGVIPGAHPGFPQLFVDTLTYKPFDGAAFSEAASGVNEPDNWHVTVTYTPWQADPAPPGSYDPVSDPIEVLDLLTTSMQFSTEAMSLPGYSLKWQMTGNQIASENVSAYILVHTTQFGLMIPKARRIPWAAIRENRGKVNETAFWGAEPETVLYNGASVSARYFTDGTRVFDVEHSFTEKQIVWGSSKFGWNYIWDPDNKRFDRPLGISDGNTLYALSSTFGSLLTA